MSKQKRLFQLFSCTLLFAVFLTGKAYAATSLVGDLSYSDFHAAPNPVAVNETTHLYTKIHYDSAKNVSITAKVQIEKGPFSFPPDFSNNGWSCSDKGSIYECTYSIAPGDDSSLLDIALTAPGSTQSVTLDANVTSDDILPESDGDNDAQTTVGVGKSNVAAAKTSTPDTVSLGEEYTYTVDITNEEKSGAITTPASGIRVEDPIDDTYLTITDYSGNTGWDCGASTSSKIDCRLNGNLEVNASTQLVFKVRTANDKLPPDNKITNTAHVTTSTSDWDANDQDPHAETTVLGTDLELDLAAPLSVLVGATGVEYNATIRNKSGMSAKNVKLNITFSHAVTLQNSTLPAGWSCDTGNAKTFACSYSGDLNSSAGDQNLKLSFDFPDDWVGGDDYTFEVVSDPDIDTDSSNNKKTGTTHVEGADVVITKTPLNATKNINDTIAYTFTVTNNGAAAAEQVAFSDRFYNNANQEKDVELVSASGDFQCYLSPGDTFNAFSCEYKDNGGSWKTLASGASVTETLEVRLIESSFTASSTKLHNQAHVTTQTTENDDTDNDSGVATVTVRLPQIDVTKGAVTANGGNDLTLGETFYYEINVTESNGVDVRNLSLTDQLTNGADRITVTNLSGSNWDCSVSDMNCSYTGNNGIFPGGSTSTIRVDAKASDSQTGHYTNRASVSATTPSTGDKDDTVSGDIVGPDFTFTKTVPASVTANETFDVNFTVTNIGLSDAEDVRLVDDLVLNGKAFTWTPADPPNWDCTTHSTTTKIDCTYTGNSGVFPGRSQTTEHLSFTVTAPNAVGDYTNSAQLDSSTTGGPWNASDSFSVVGADLRAEKSVTTPASGYGIANETMTYQITVYNDGNALAKDVTAHDVLDSRIDPSTVTVDGCDNSPSGTLEIDCQLPDITPHGSRSFTVTFTAPDIDADDFQNEGNVSTSTAENDTSNNTYSLTSEIRGADIFVTKTIENKSETNGVYQASLGEEAVFVITVKNSGEANASGITLEDRSIDLDGGSQRILLTGIADDDGGKWSCGNSFPTTTLDCSYSGTLAGNGDSTTLKVNGTMPDSAGHKQNEANASAAVGAEANPGNNLGVAKVDVQSYDLNITKTLNGEAVIDRNVTFRLDIRNLDLSDISDFWVQDQLPAGFTAVSASGDGWNCDSSTLYCEYNDTLAGNSGPISLTVVATAPSTAKLYTNRADVNHSNAAGDSDPANNEDALTFQVYGADLHIYKTDAPDPVAPGGTITYTISIDNADGRVDAENVTIEDSIPAHTAFVTDSNQSHNGWECGFDGNTFTCHKDLLPAGAAQEEVLTFQVKVDPGISVPNTIYNTVTSENDISEHDYEDNNLTVETEVRKVNLRVRKFANHQHKSYDYGTQTQYGYAGFGDKIRYRIQFRNNSPQGAPDITDINFTDTLPDNAEYLGYTPDDHWSCTENNTSTPKTLTCLLDHSVSVARGQNVYSPYIYVRMPDADSSYDTSDYHNNKVVNRVTATIPLTEDTYADNNASTVTYLMGSDLHIEKTDGTTDHEAGANAPLTYTLSVKNRNDHHHGIWGLSDAENIRVLDILPPEINASDIDFSGTGGEWNCSVSGGVVTCDANGTLESGESLGKIRIHTHAPNLLDANLTNSARVTSDTPELDLLLDDNEANVTTHVTGANIDVIITADKNSSAMAAPLTYTVTVRNIGKGEARDVRFITGIAGVTRDFGYTSVDNAPDWNCTQPDVNKSVECLYNGVLGEGDEASATLHALTPTQTGGLTNEVNASTSTVETDAYNFDSVTTTIVGAQLVLNVSPQPDSGGAFMPKTYTFTLKNDGLSPTTDINLTLAPESVSPYGFEILDADGTDWNCTLDGNTSADCLFGSLAADASTQVVLKVLLPNKAGGTYITGTAAYRSLDDNLTTSEVNATIDVTGSDLTVTKTVQNDMNATGFYDTVSVGIDQNITFRLQVENRNSGRARDINISDAFDTRFKDINVTSAGDWNCSVSGHDLLCTLPDLNTTNGTTDENTIFIHAKTPAYPVPDGIENNASVASVTVESDSGNNIDTALVKVLGPELTGDLDANVSVVAMKDDFRYIVKVTNVGFSQSADINLTYDLPDGMSLVGSEDNSSWTAGSLWSCHDSNGSAPVICEFTDNMPPYGAYSYITLDVKAPGYPGPLDNNFTLVYDHETNITASPLVTVWPADVEAEAEAQPSDEVLAERNITYRIRVADLNISDAEDVNLSLDFIQNDASHNPVSIDTDDSDCNVTGGIVLCRFGTMEALSERNITVTVTVPDTNTSFAFKGSLDLNTSSPEADTDNDFALPAVEVKPILPVADWRMDDCVWNGTAGEVTDQTGSHNGTAHNGAHTYSMLLPLAKDDTNRTSFCRSGYFDGDNDYVAVANSSEINTGKHNKRSISLWFKTEKSEGTQVIYEEGGGARGLAVYIQNGQLFAGGWNSPESGWSGTYLPVSFTLGRWHHVVLVLDAEKDAQYTQPEVFRGYLDGTLFGEGAGSQLWSHGDAVGIGAVNGGTKIPNSNGKRPYQGLIDEVKIFNIALDDRAVHEIFEREKEYVNYDGTARTCMECAANLSVDIDTVNDINGSIGADSLLRYRVTVKNDSDDPVGREVNLTANFDADLSFEDNLTVDGLWSCGDFNASSHILPCYFLGDETNYLEPHSTSVFEISFLTQNREYEVTSDAHIDINQTNDGDEDASVTTKVLGTDMAVTMDIPGTPTRSEDFDIIVHVSNLSDVAVAKAVEVTTLFDDLDYVSTDCPNANIGAHHVQCSLPNFQPNDSFDYNITVRSNSALATTTVASDVNTSTFDRDTDNNHYDVSFSVVDTNNSTGDILEQQFIDFRRHAVFNRYGNMVVIGNSNLKPADGNDYNGYLADLNSSFVQTAGGPNSSGAVLKLPDGIPVQDLSIEYVGLYWSGHVHGEEGDTNDTGESVPYNQVALITPWGAEYNISVNTGSSASDDNITGYYYYKKSDGVYRRFYACEANITGILADRAEQNLSVEGSYTVKGIQADDGVDVYTYAPLPGNKWTSLLAYGNFGGWSMVVVYSVDHKKHRAFKFRNLAVFDGYQKLAPVQPDTNESIQLDIGGFITPVSGNIDSQIRLFTSGSERAVDAESMTITDKNGTAHEVYRDPVNPKGNILNDTIDLYYNEGTSITRNLSLGYNPGIDADEFNASNYLQNEQNETTIRLTASKPGVEGEQTFPSMITFATNIYTPDFIDSYKECFIELPDGNYLPCDDPNAKIYRGSTVIYRVTVVNTGDIFASHLTIVDPLPYQLDFDKESAQFVVTVPKPLNGPDAVKDNILQPEGIQEINASLDPGYKIPQNMVSSVFNPAGDVTTEEFTDGEHNRTKVIINLDDVINNNFPARHFAWVEFRTKVNKQAEINGTFENTAIINFTNPTLEAFGYADANQTQEAASVGSPPVEFQWAVIEGNVKDPGRLSVGTKIATANGEEAYKFDLNISVDDNATFISYYPDVNLSIASIQLVDGDDGNSTVYPVHLGGNLYSTYPDLNDSAFVSPAWLPVSQGMSWRTAKIFWSARAYRNLYFKIRYKIKIPGIPNPVLSPYYKYYGDHFAIRPRSFQFSSSDSLGVTTYNGEPHLVMTAGHPFDVNISAVDMDDMTVLDYNTTIDINETGALETDEMNATCYPEGIGELHFNNVLFLNGTAIPLQNVKFDNVGFVTFRLKDNNWTMVDRVNNDCNATDDNDQDQNDTLVSCAVKGELRYLFVPAKLKVETEINNWGAGFTYMHNNLDEMNATLTATVTSLNEEGNTTTAFMAGCYADDVNLTLQFAVTSQDKNDINLLWKAEESAGTPPPIADFGNGAGIINALEVNASLFNNGIANAAYAFDINRSTKKTHMPVIFDSASGQAGIDDYLTTNVDVAPVAYALNADNNATFWYGRLHAPDYRSQTADIDTPIYIEVFCNDDLADCSFYGITGMAESSDDVNWWVNAKDSTSAVVDLNATQRGVISDPYIKINNGTNAVTDLNLPFAGGISNNSPTVSYTGGENLYKTRIRIDIHNGWLRYNPFYSDGHTEYNVEFNLPNDKWSGIGAKGETVETNGSAKTNRRLEW
ncbi:LamG-like jellyroll fold domain-containing protein [Hydrogenimonas sp. SS33]|uniref:LamG-like jellyroll fold domain-containing protein n=1 Tax=Hydrogenimonas leucolamina TaxID=2954236 RepID=UPI00336C19CB